MLVVYLLRSICFHEVCFGSIIVAERAIWYHSIWYHLSICQVVLSSVSNVDSKLVNMLLCS